MFSGISLLDRLDASLTKPSDVVESVRADLTRLLNTPRSVASDASLKESWPNGYGVDMSLLAQATTGSPEFASRLCQDIAWAIAHYEPRLQDVRIGFDIDIRGRLRLRLAATLHLAQVRSSPLFLAIVGTNDITLETI